ncbi:hypothetical protein [Marinitenerispora sediminis]|nr:hypothetical protein [Marinitenerispora sediminis]
MVRSILDVIRRALICHQWCQQCYMHEAIVNDNGKALCGGCFNSR